ncbi:MULTISPECIES: LpqB family beta-propeller domain-containing protein [Amycolatopsis]|uniref:LpqB family beta-propeller domain-containing protein n=1 Tax=Amycolatopsis tucumanensis TaxID=401106 RepID=A0ABP7IP12_9PSEU|nr:MULTISPECIES: LpqB family beta-propeller domain-containing protein [Amycolatopsis]MCF6428035.1 LpqB family beta-propeller domain-containing protein [Amycolatopsis tucumanensis]
MRVLSRLFALFACLVLAAGCANVPEESQPVAVPQQELGQPVNPDVPQPAKDLDALTVVRDFVRASAQPISNNAAARMYLDEGAAKAWAPGKVITIIDDVFATVPATGADTTANPNEVNVVLRGTGLGTLREDGAFISLRTPVELKLLVRRQSDGQWRITNPPPNLVMPYSDFTANYVRVQAFFFAQDSNTVVPDLRYVAGKPQTGLAGRVVGLLLAGPSTSLVGAVRNLLPEDANTEGNVTTAPDGALVVPLTGVADQTADVRRLIAAQIVLSLQSVTTNRVRLLSDGAPLVDGHEDWVPSDLPSYTALASPSADQPGLVTVNGRVRSLGDGSLISGPAGQGSGYQVASAAQSIDGRQLAIVEYADGRQRLRVGQFGKDAAAVDLAGATMTRPTWRPTATADGSGEVWTVVDGQTVVRALRTPDGSWVPQVVNADEILQVGPISVLRLSRDGARAAVVAGGQLLVASVVRTQDSVTLRAPRILQGGTLGGVVDVDWLSQDALVAATTMPSQPVVKIPIDGLRLDPFNISNLTLPVHAITAAPGRSIVVADDGGLWTASDVGEVWRPHPHSFGGNASPFYPG